MAERNKKTNRTKLGLKVLGFIFTAGGLTCTVIGSASFFSALGSGELPTLFWLLIAGLPMLTIGASLLTFGFRKELSATAIQIARAGENLPTVAAQTVQEGENSPTVAAQTVREGENSPIEPAPLPEQTPKKATLRCPECGAENDAELNFCEQCGSELTKPCPHCGKPVGAHAAFCGHCGKKI